jgi:hypothetical protein
MANKVRGQIPANLDGGKINLLLHVNSICELEDAADRPITDILDELNDPKRARMKTVRLMFWAMMLQDKPDATIEDAGRLIQDMRGNHDQVMTDAILAAFPDASDAAGEGDQSGK